MHFNIFYVTISNTTIYLIHDTNYYFLPIYIGYKFKV